MKFENYEQFAIHYDRISNRTDANDYIKNLQNKHMLGMGSDKTPSKLSMAKAAFYDIYPEIKNDTAMSKRIFEALYINTTPGLRVNLGDNGQGDIYNYRDIFTEYMPAMIQRGKKQDAHGHLIDILVQKSVFKDKYKLWQDDHLSIAQQLYSRYRVIDTKGTEALVYTTKELNDNLVDIQDVKDAIPYFMLYFDKKKGTTIEVIPSDPRLKGKNQIDTVQLMNTQVKTNDEDATMWIAFRRDRNSKGLEAVIMGGNYEEGNYDVVGRPEIKQEKFVRPRRPKEVTRQPFIVPDDVAWKIIKDAKSYFYFEAENDFYEAGAEFLHGTRKFARRMGVYDVMGEGKYAGDYTIAGQDTLKTKMQNYINKYGEKAEDAVTGKTKYRYTSKNAKYLFNWKSIPKWLVEFAEPRQFEFEHIIAPFWEKHGDKSEPDFEKAWNLHITENTYNWRDRWWNEMWQDWADVISPPEVQNPLSASY